MKKHIMIDIETWDTKPSALIRAMAVASFTPDSIISVHLLDLRNTLDEQIELGGTISLDTVEFWRHTFNLGALLDRTCVNDHEVQVKIARMSRCMHIFNKLNTLDVTPDTTIWSRGSFDLDILESLATGLDFTLPWTYWQRADVRTLDQLIPKPVPTRPHDPVSDCLAQILHVQKTLNLIENVKKA